MPEISVFCPGCGRPVATDDEDEMETSVAPLSRDALLGVIAYFALVPAIALLLIPGTKKNLWVRFHAWQSILLAVATIVSGIVTKLLVQLLAIVPFGLLLGWLLA